jgi:murein DD-endopeptidase MepM/ murein hydrolase activator NlpD
LKVRKTFSDWLSSRYLLILRNEENFAERTSFSFTYAKLIVFFVTIFLLLFSLSLYLSTTLLAAWLDPRHAEVEANRQVVRLSMAVDSLAEEMKRKDLYIQSFGRLLSGDLETDSAVAAARESGQSIARPSGDAIYNIPEVDSSLRSEFEGSLLDRTFESATGSDLQEIFFFSPISGIISAPYDPKIDHYGADIVAKQNETVKSVADGTVLLSSWTQKEGYILAIQHRSNLVSLYKHNSALLKQAGDFVRAGEVIAVIGNTGELTTGPHLHFELWYNGNPVNPEEFVSF